MNTFDLLEDVRGQVECPPTDDGGKSRHLKWKTKPEKIDTLVLHQMACKGPGPWTRWKKLAAHWVITAEEPVKAYWLHDFTKRLPTSHDYNSHSIGFEFEGYYSGIGIDEKYFWKPKSKPNRKPMVPTQRQLDACIAACEASIWWVQNVGGGQIKYIGAHRGSFGTKRSDPGSLIWQGVAIPLMKKYPWLSPAPVEGTGKPIPEVWDPERSPGIKY
jgi:hypothetical protein